MNEDLVPVIIGVEDDGIRMSANGTEIGEWSTGDFTIDHRGDGVYTITADNESLTFTPNRPDLFAVGLGHPATTTSPPVHTRATPESTLEQTAPTADPGSPKPITRALFYTLSGTTAALGVWAMLRLIF